MSPLLVLGLVLASGGAALALVGMRRTQGASLLEDALADLDGALPSDAYVERLSEPLPIRVLRPAGAWLTQHLTTLLPGNHLEQTRRKLVRAGVAARVSAEEFLATQAISLGAGVVLGALALSSASVEGPRRLALFMLLVFIGALAPVAWLSRKRDERVSAIKRDLPDVLDLMAISVEAGVGLEGALEIAVRNFDSPLAMELGHTLREMKLGLTRREALQNVRGRVDVPELSGFVLSLLQADALGMPLARVLRTQAGALRDRRRQAAREAAAKLPVKMLFPMALFILPAIFVVALGPAALQIMRALG